ncbi:NfeD family protein [Pseudodesulfovibrio sediminis]|uniref:NfeD-like C-terminal domain-containing protein n=1 Tax=Pseudodesulfovibrio sediminis TaxID=2810563 RepID=A0ABM7P839_9BACT|nr:NfeD family protein [Pseudodesulfovibrio sediminis]BCS89152.1 hypothetical protein PSDVSF_23940 [Pseudodesulfovibrio sediminis]
MEYFSSMENVLWLIWLSVGVIFIVAELIVPGFIIVFFGVGALIAGATAFFGSTIPIQLIVFGVSSLVMILVFRKTMAKTFAGSDADDDSEENDSAIGQMAEVVEAIKPPHVGRIKFQGSFWNALCDETIETGTMIRIVNRTENDANTFTVKKEQ